MKNTKRCPNKGRKAKSEVKVGAIALTVTETQCIRKIKMMLWICAVKNLYDYFNIGKG